MERMKGRAMIGRAVNQEKLEADGWELITFRNDAHLIFGKGDRRIVLNEVTGIIEREYTYKPPKSSNKDVSSPNVPFFWLEKADFLCQNEKTWEKNL